MRVIVLGSGVIGVTSAYYLAEAGHEVVVLDRQEGPALETSFANAGEVSPGYASPWAAPGIPLKALKWLFMRHRPLFIWPKPDPDLIRWGLRMLMNCTAARYEINKGRMVPLAEYSRDRLRELRAKRGIAYDERSQGTLQLFRTQKMLDGTAKDIAILQKYGVPYELLDVDGCVAGRAGAGPGPGEDRGRAAAARRRDRRLLQVHQCPGRGLPPAGRRVPQRHPDRRPPDRGRQDHRRRHRQGHRHRRRLRHGAGQLLAAAAAPGRDRPAGLPGQGLLAHHPDHRSCRRPGIDGHGRDPQGGDHPAGRPDPGRRHGRARRLQHQAAAGAARHARACRHRPLPQGRRRRPRPASGAGCGR